MPPPARLLHHFSAHYRAQEYEAMGDGAFPGNGSPKINKDYEIVKLRKKIDAYCT